MASMMILQNADKCIRCNGCVIACKRTWQLKGITGSDYPNQKISMNQRMVIKPQKRVDTVPHVRYSCWHCSNPPCTARCPFKAVKQDPDTGAVYIDEALCTPDGTATAPPCKKQCQYDCQHGGFIRIGAGTDKYPGEKKAQKCTLCYGRAGAAGDLPTKAEKSGANYISSLKKELELAPAYPGRAALPTFPDSGAALADLAHMPACVQSCPAKAMYWDTTANVAAYVNYCLGLAAGDPLRIVSAYGSGHMAWVSRKYALGAPKADPFIEDHVVPMVSGLLNSPFAKAALVPTLVAGGLLALSARRATIESEHATMTGGEAR